MKIPKPSAHARSEEARAELAYWGAANRRSVPELPFVRGVESSAVFSLPESETSALLREANAAHGTDIEDLLLAALARTLANWAGADRIVVDVRGHGREDLFEDMDLTRTIGLFMTIRTRFDARIGGAKRDYFLRDSAALSTTPGSSRLSVDQDAGSPCSAFKSFGTWSTTLP